MNNSLIYSILFWFFAAVVIILVCLGLYFLFLHIFDVSEKKKTKNFNKLIMNSAKRNSSLSAQIDEWGIKLENNSLIKKMINPYKREKMVNEFNILGINKTPEAHLAASLITGIIFIPVALLIMIIFALFGHFTIGLCVGMFFILIGVLIALLEYNSIGSMISKRKEKIERELPSFISFVENTLKNDRDIVNLISSYTEEGDSPLIDELKVLLVDLKTGDYEYAFNRFSNRTNSSFVSEISRGLIAAMRGDDVKTYFEMLSFNLWEIEKRRLEKEALKKPKRVKILTFFLYAGMMLLYIVVFATVILEGLADIF